MRNDDAFDREVEVFLKTYIRNLLKAPLIGLMVAFEVSVVSQSVYKTLWAFALFTMLSFFTTWRRFLEPMAFFALIPAMIAFVHPTTFADLASALVRR